MLSNISSTSLPLSPVDVYKRQEHFQAILYFGSVFFALLHEEGFVGSVDEVVEQGVAVHCLVRQRRTLVYVWVQALSLIHI